MRSARTDRPSTVEQPSARHHSRTFRDRRRVPRLQASSLPSRLRRATPLARAALALALLTVVLAGCATGNAQDARRGRERDATRADVLPHLQATLIARRFNATPVPPPPPTPIPTIETLALTVGVNPDGSPQQPVTSISSGQAGVYVTALIHDLRQGEKVVVSWRTVAAGTAAPGGVEVGTSDIPVTADTDQRWFAFPLTVTLPPGDYAAWIAVSDQTLNSLVFHVSG